MLTIEMKINGTVIGQIYAHNEGYVGKPPDDTCTYKWHCYTMSMQGEPKLKEGVLEHKRNDGFLMLGKKLFAAAQFE